MIEIVLTVGASWLVWALASGDVDHWFRVRAAKRGKPWDMNGDGGRH